MRHTIGGVCGKWSVWIEEEGLGEWEYGKVCLLGRARSYFFFFFSSRRRHTRLTCDWSSDVCSSDLVGRAQWNFALARTAVAGQIHQVQGAARLQSLDQRREDRTAHGPAMQQHQMRRSEERRVGKESRSGWSASH